MSWSPVAINPPVSTTINAVNALSKHVVTPWDDGDGVGIHARLSFPNAVTLLAKKLPPNMPCLGLAITAANFNDFAGQCSQLITAFDLPVLQQWQRRGLALAALEDEKMNLVSEQVPVNNSVLNALPAISALHVADLRKQAFDDAVSFNSSDPMTNLTAFQAEKTSHDAEVFSVQGNAQAGLSGGAGWRFYAVSDVSNAVLSGAPGNEFTITAGIVWSGSVQDLSLLNEIIQ